MVVFCSPLALIGFIEEYLADFTLLSRQMAVVGLGSPRFGPADKAMISLKNIDPFADEGLTTM
jgi:hypothetical protein